MCLSSFLLSQLCFKNCAEEMHAYNLCYNRRMFTKKLYRTLSLILCTVLVMTCLPLSVEAEQPDYSDRDYWTSACTNTDNLNGSLKDSCQAFVVYLSNQSSSLKEKIASIDAKQSEVSDDIETVKAEIEQYQSEIASINADIEDLKNQISDLDNQIDTLNTQADDLKSRVSAQISASQSDMRLSKVIDILMGAESFSQLIRLANGLSDVTQYNNQTLQKLIDTENEIKANKEALSTKQDELSQKQEDAVAAMYEAQLLQQEYEEKAQELAAQSDAAEKEKSSADAAVSSVQEAQKQAAAIAELARQAAAKKAAEEAAAKKKAEEEAARKAAEQKNTSSNTSSSTTVLPGAYVAANASSIYVALVTTYGFTKAAACGIIANIQIESTFNPAADNGAGYYGICQWGGSRLNNLYSFLSSHGYSTSSLEGELAFMYSELQGYNMISTLNSYANSAAGASQAGVYFRQNFERSAGLNGVSSIAAGYFNSLQ